MTLSKKWKREFKYVHTDLHNDSEEVFSLQTWQPVLVVEKLVLKDKWMTVNFQTRGGEGGNINRENLAFRITIW